MTTSLLIIKTSSLGDVIHTLPALTDAAQQIPNLQCDWVVEEAFAEIPTWHSAVKRVIPVALRRWRKHPWQSRAAWQTLKQTLRSSQYDYVIDAQGLIKSAFLTSQTHGLRCGLDWRSAREPLATFAYHRRYSISKEQHAIARVRQLFAMSLGYDCKTLPLDYGIRAHFPSPKNSTAAPILVFLHGTTWITKQWTEAYWVQLTQRAMAAGYTVYIPFGNDEEQARAQRLAALDTQVILVPKGNLQDLARLLAKAQAVVGVDTGLAHLAAALAVPSVTLYGATQAARTGTCGLNQIHLQATFPCAPCLSKRCIYSDAPYPPCYTDLSVERVWTAVTQLLQI